jgi:hypothetical protein
MNGNAGNVNIKASGDILTGRSLTQLKNSDRRLFFEVKI